MIEYTSLILNGYTTKPFLDAALKELTESGYTLIPVVIRGDILIFERNKLKDEN